MTPANASSRPPGGGEVSLGTDSHATTAPSNARAANHATSRPVRRLILTKIDHLGASARKVSAVRRDPHDLLEARRPLGQLLDGRLPQRQKAVVARLAEDLLGARLGHDQAPDLVVDLQDFEHARPSQQARRTTLHTSFTEGHHELRLVALGSQLLDVQPEERELVRREEI